MADLEKEKKDFLTKYDERIKAAQDQAKAQAKAKREAKAKSRKTETATQKASK